MRLKVRFFLTGLCAIMVTLLAQPSLAYYTTVGSATNVITSGSLSLRIHEKTAEDAPFPADGVYVVPGDIVSKRVYIENTCTHPFYLRVQPVSTALNQTLSAADCLRMDIDTEHWILRDGYYYYYTVLQPGEKTLPVFSNVEIVGAVVNSSYIGSTLNLTVNASAVQSENNPAQHPWEANGWPADA